MRFKKVIAVTLGLLGLGLVSVKAVWNVATPSGSESKSMGDDRIRELKSDLQTSLQHEGDFPGSDTSNPRFIFTPSTGTTAARPTGNDRPTGKMYIDSDTDSLEIWNGSQWMPQNLVYNNSVDELKINTSIAGDGIGGGNGSALHLKYDSNLFSISSDSVTVVANSIGSTQIADSVTIPTLAVTTQTWGGFGLLPILQIQTGTSASATTTTSASYVDTSLTVSITPKFSTSKILVFANGTASAGSSAGNDVLLTIARAGTNLATTGNSSFATIQAGSPFIENVTMFVYDAPATTSSTAYTVRMKTEGGNTGVFPTDAFGATGIPVASIIAVEIAQ